MTIQEIEQNINLMSVVIKDAQEALNKYQKALAELKDSKKEGKWKPELHDKFWFRDTYGDTTATVHNHITNMNIFENTKVFPTKEECERYWHFMDTVKEKSYEFSKEEIQDSSIYKFSIGYVPSNNRFYISYDADCKYFGKIYFKTEEDAQYIIDNFKDELMEYWI